MIGDVLPLVVSILKFVHKWKNNLIKQMKRLLKPIKTFQRKIGTIPEKNQAKKIHIFVNGKYTEVPENLTIYEATSTVLPKHQKSKFEI